MSSYSLIPLMYHPTNVVLLDDDQKFLNDVSLVLKDTIPYVLNDDPEKILNYLQSHTYQPDALSALLVKQVFDGEQSHASETFAINFSRLQENLTLPARFKMSTVSLIDRRMKKIDGLEFCQAIREKDLLVKTILFTGQTGADEAVQAFNQKVIDGFLVKEGDPNILAQKINTTITEHAWRQFADLGKTLSGLLSHILKPLSDQQLIAVFEKIYKSNQIIEFYLLDSSCSFLLLTADGKAKQLFVRNEADYKDCYEIAKDVKAPSEVLQALRSRKMFPYTKKIMGYAKLPGDTWDEAMVQMDKVSDRKLYYTIVDRPDVNAYSFNQYLKEVWPQP